MKILMNLGVFGFGFWVIMKFLKIEVAVIFASHPKTEAAKYISYGFKGMSFAEYGPCILAECKEVRYNGVAKC